MSFPYTAVKVLENVEVTLFSFSFQLLVQEMELQCDPALAAMTKMPWSSIESVGDQSAYVTSFFNHIKQTIPLVRDNLVKHLNQNCHIYIVTNSLMVFRKIQSFVRSNVYSVIKASTKK